MTTLTDQHPQMFQIFSKNPQDYLHNGENKVLVYKLIFTLAVYILSFLSLFVFLTSSENSYVDTEAKGGATEKFGEKMWSGHLEELNKQGAGNICFKCNVVMEDDFDHCPISDRCVYENHGYSNLFKRQITRANFKKLAWTTSLIVLFLELIIYQIISDQKLMKLQSSNWVL